jgi:ribosome-binding factor A
MAEVKRSTRVAESIREELASLLSTELSDPRLEGVVVSEVRLSDDLKVAKVLFRLLRLDATTDDQTRAKAGLERATGLLRREITDRLSLRHAPELRFVYDAGQDARLRVEELLHEISEESKGKKR